MADNKGEIIMYQPDETIRLEVRMGKETVWLTQQQMAELFDKDSLFFLCFRLSRCHNADE